MTDRSMEYGVIGCYLSQISLKEKSSFTTESDYRTSYGIIKCVTKKKSRPSERWIRKFKIRFLKLKICFKKYSFEIFWTINYKVWKLKILTCGLLKVFNLSFYSLVDFHVSDWFFIITVPYIYKLKKPRDLYIYLLYTVFPQFRNFMSRYCPLLLIYLYL